MRPLAALAALTLATAAQAFPISYQGELGDNGAPANGLYDMTFQLTDSPTFGLLLDTDTIRGVSVVNGLFSVEVEFDDALFDGSERWIAVVVEGVSLSPRQHVTHAPYAIYSDRAREAGTVRVPLVLVGDSVVIEGYANASNGTGVRGVHLNGSGVEPGVEGQTNSGSSSAVGVLGEVLDTTAGSFSAGVRGNNHSTTGTGIGVYGSHAGSGWGVYGTTPDGRGVYGNSADGVGVRGFSTNNHGVTAATTSGVALIADHNDADTHVELGTDTYAVFATNIADEGEGTGIRGEGGDTGVHGHAPGEGFGAGLDRTGVLGTSGDFSSGAMHFYGVRGFGQAPPSGGGRFAYGVYGSAQAGSSSNTSYGVYGQETGVTGSFSYAGYFNGDVHITGTLSKSSGSFKIDHPLDPETKYLSHSFVESPEMLNIYTGVAVLDENGRAHVALPSYFEALNESFRYQLTPIGAPMRDLHIAAEVSDNAFAIAGGVPGAKVSWEVAGVRHDASAQHHAITVEEDKAPEHHGLYLDPEAFGLDASRGIHTRHTPNH
ncbi:MAG: hypothetical protein DHS20C14_06370 [Phycisphaeraceae bacterium]|nr:MAG: hypothetical protein DHS20C14_06370 [Phycisphaeraceae bacterium]